MGRVRTELRAAEPLPPNKGEDWIAAVWVAGSVARVVYAHDDLAQTAGGAAHAGQESNVNESSHSQNCRQFYVRSPLGKLKAAQGSGMRCSGIHPLSAAVQTAQGQKGGGACTNVLARRASALAS